MKLIRKPITLIVLISLFVFLPILHKSELFLSRTNDLQEFFWPIYHYAKYHILNSHQLPFWNTLFLSGTPLLPDPQSPIFYLPNIIFLIVPIGTGFISSSIVHTIIGGIGIYALSKRHLKLTTTASLIAAFFYLASPRLAGYLEAGHFGLIMSTAWLPWVMFGIFEIVFAGSLLGAVIFASSLAFVFFTHTTSFILVAACSLPLYFLSLYAKKPRSGLFRRLYLFGVGIILSFGLISVTLFPQLRWTPHTTRFILTTDRDVYPKWNSKIEFLVDALFPYGHGLSYIQEINTEKWIPIGIFLLFLSTIGYFTLKRKIKIIIAGSVTVVFLIALNNASPFYSLLLSQDWYVLTRVATRLWFVITLMMTLLAAVGINILLKKKMKKIVFILSLLAFLELILLSWTKISKPVVHTSASLPLAGLQFLSKDTDKFRVVCLTRCISQKDAAIHKLELVDGYSTLQQRNFYQYAWQLFGAHWDYYTLSIPPFGSYLENNLKPDVIALGEYNTKYIIAPFQITNDALELKEKYDNFFIYQNAYFQPRAYYYNITKTYQKPAIITEYSPNYIRINIDQREGNTLVLSEVHSPFWNAYINGKTRIQVQQTPNALRLVNLPSGSQFIEFRYEDPFFVIGLILSSISLAIIIKVFYKNKHEIIKIIS